MASVTISNVGKAYADQTVLHGVSLDVRDGEFLSLVGPSGCGKSTLLRTITGLEEQDGGEIRIGEARVDRMRPRERDVAMVFQSYALYPHLSAYDNIAAPLRMRRLSPVQRFPLLGALMPSRRGAEADFQKEIAGVAEMLRLQPLLRRKPGQLSGGQRQRVALARAIVRHPAVFLMDEPLSNLDAKLRDTTRSEIAALHRRLGATFIYVTHDQAEAMTMSDRIAVMMEGRLLQVGTPDEIYNDPQTLGVAEFIGSPQINVLQGVRSAEGVAVGPTLLPLVPDVAADAAVTLAFRPHGATLHDDRAACGLAGIVAHVENLGSDLYVHVRVEAGAARPVVLRLDPAERRRFEIGAPAYVRPHPEHVLCFDAKTGDRIAMGGRP